MQALADGPNFSGIAAANLAWVYLQEGRKSERRAQHWPSGPEAPALDLTLTTDTLALAYYKEGLYAEDTRSDVPGALRKAPSDRHLSIIISE